MDRDVHDWRKPEVAAFKAARLMIFVQFPRDRKDMTMHRIAQLLLLDVAPLIRRTGE
jgi:hypothetical protein